MSRWIICPVCLADDKYKDDCPKCNGVGILTGNEKDEKEATDER